MIPLSPIHQAKPIANDNEEGMEVLPFPREFPELTQDELNTLEAG